MSTDTTKIFTTEENGKVDAREEREARRIGQAKRIPRLYIASKRPNYWGKECLGEMGKKS